MDQTQDLQTRHRETAPRGIPLDNHEFWGQPHLAKTFHKISIIYIVEYLSEIDKGNIRDPYAVSDSFPVVKLLQKSCRWYFSCVENYIVTLEG